VSGRASKGYGSFVYRLSFYDVQVDGEVIETASGLECKNVRGTYSCRLVTNCTSKEICLVKHQSSNNNFLRA
jgi:hypothetical protein